MNLQDLKDDLALAEELYAPADDPTPMMVVARRVAALYQTCPDCKGEGYWSAEVGNSRATDRCSRCGGQGVEPVDKNWPRAGALGGPWFVAPMWPHDLARYLFGEE